MRSAHPTSAILAPVFAGALLLSSAPAHAKWWTFGKSQDKPEITRVQVAGIDVDSVRDKLSLQQESLEGGEVVIKGFTSSAGSPIALAEVSLDDGQDWQKAELSRGGAFVFRFKPAPDKAYDLAFRVMDTGGKKSDPKDISPVKVVYKDVPIGDPVKEALKSLISAYVARDKSAFMEGVSQDYRGDPAELENAIEDDFSSLTDVAIDPIVDTIVASGQEARVTFHFDWRATSQQSGQPVKPAQDSSILTFRHEGDKFKLIEMAAPAIFGVSRASRITTGSGTTGTPPSETTPDVFDQGGPGARSRSPATTPQ